MNNPLSNFLLVITFFSRIPLPASLGRQISDDSKLTDAAAYFPLAGLVIALIPAFVWLLSTLALPPIVAAAIALLSGIIVTGALHEDGLADCADGIGATADREKSLEIMRDSRIGTYGAIALVASFSLRWISLSTFDVLEGILALLIAHSASRAAMVIAMRFSSYARKDGLGKLASGELSDSTFMISLAIPCIVAIVAAWTAGLMAVAVGLLMAWLLLKFLEHRLGGYTGDGLGAMQQICEIAIMVTLVGFWA